MSQATHIDIGALLERKRFGWFHFLVLVNTCLVMAIEGYDMQVTSFAAPALLKSWHLAPAIRSSSSDLGSSETSSVGLFLDTWEIASAEKVIVGGSIFFGIFTFAAAYSSSVVSLVVLRFLAGCGIGASIPAAIALAVEYSPAHLRARIIGFLFFGYTAGGTAGGFIAAKVIPAYGWPSVFKIGGAGPIMLGILVLFTLPESIRYLVLKQKQPDVVLLILGKLGAAGNIGPLTQFTVAEKAEPGLPVRQLFSHGRAITTSLLWLAFVSSLLGHYFLTSWLPTILSQAAEPLGYAIIAGALLQGGGGFGGIALCWLSDKKSMSFIALAYCVACPLIILLPHGHGMTLLFLSFFVGFFLVGGQIGLNAIAGTIYPTHIRSTGVGWALGVGRLGSIAGPVLGGFLIADHIPISSLFIYTGWIALVCAAAVFLVFLRPASHSPNQQTVPAD